MDKRLVVIAMLAGIVSMAAVACGGDDDEAAAPGAPADVSPGPLRALSPTPEGRLTGGVTRQEGDTIDFTVYLHEGRLWDRGLSPLPFFAPKEMAFKVGQTVNFTFIGDPGSKLQHTFTVADLGIDQRVRFGATVKFSYAFDRAGKFRLRCLEYPGMVGTITVE